MKLLLSSLFIIFSIFKAHAIEATHGMVLFGQENTFAYHLPMFHKIHNKQIVLTFDIDEQVKNQINKAQLSNFLTFVPAPFDLEKFIVQPFDLKGDIYSGHFEKDGIVIMEGVIFKNPKIIFLNEIVKPIGRTAGYKSENYQIFGNANELFALHLIDGGTATDQIFKISLTSGNEETIEHVKKFNTLKNFKLLELGSEYSIETEPGRCPSRLCGTPGRELAKFKIESLYFADEVM